MEYSYKVKPLAQYKIRSFYYNVAKKYKHAYSKWLMPVMYRTCTNNQ